MKANEDKCHLIVSTNELTEIQIRDFSTKNGDSEKLLGFNIDSKLNFDCLINHSCSKAKKKLRVLARVTPYMTLEKKSCHEFIFYFPCKNNLKNVLNSALIIT